MRYYATYAKEKSFAVSKRSSKRMKDGEVHYVTIACNRQGKQRIRGNNITKMHPQSKLDCKAKVRAVLCPSGKWILNSVQNDHNHELSPRKTRFFRCNKVLQPLVKRRLELNDKAGIRMNKSYYSLVIEARGPENLSYLEKDCRNYINKVRPLQLGEGDSFAMHNYFLKMQKDNSNFFYSMDLDEHDRLKNIFWADARSKAAFKEFGDVITFDTTYLVNKYDMPFAPFVGVNHHGQSTLLGCGLISNENAETFTWLFESWLQCMGGCHPSAIITDQDKAMKKAIEIVFPNARHRWCLWHIMKKVPEKFRAYKEYESISKYLSHVVYDSLTKEEFDEGWNRLLEKYGLQSNEWLFGLYQERDRWVPAFVKDIFWAGMSTTQRSEGMNAYFDGYINAKTTLKQFVEQYENALAKKVEKEKNEDFHSFHSFLLCITSYEMEKQFQQAYTTTKFKEFQREILGKISCDLKKAKEGPCISEYILDEDIPLEDGHRTASFIVYFREDSGDFNCQCRLFEFRGILCRHLIMVLIHRKIHRVPETYILTRWGKTVKRCHTKVRISYDNWSGKAETHHFDKLCNAFFEVAPLGAITEDKCVKMLARIQDIKCEFEEMEEVCGNNKPTSYSSERLHKESTLCENGVAISKEGVNILDPIVSRRKGRPPSKRKVSTCEKAIIKKKEKNKKKAKTLACVSPTIAENVGLQDSEMHQSQNNWESFMGPHHQNVLKPGSYTNMLLGGNNLTMGIGYHDPYLGNNSEEHQLPSWKSCYD